MAIKSRSKVGPYSREGAIATLDGRSKEALYMKRVRLELTAHVGAPSPVQRQLIERAAMLTLHVALFDAKALEAGGLSERDSRQYLAYSNSLSRTLTQLGLKATAAKPPSLAEHIAQRAAERDGAAA
jgi:hypothetical protein